MKYEFLAYYTSDNENMALEEIKLMVSQCQNITLTDIEVCNSERSCRNAYGKSLSVEEFESLDPDSDAAWFDDYDFVFKVTITSSLPIEEIISELKENGVDIDTDTIK